METTNVQPSPSPVQGNFVDRLWDFFCSLKLAIITLILLAATSIIGTVIEQGMTPEELAEKSGWNLNTLQFLDQSINAFDMYHSWWFLSLMGLFAVNLICCSIKRFPFVWKTVREPRLVADDGFFRTLSNVEEVVVAKGTLDEVRTKVTAFLGGKFASASVTEQDGKIYFYAEKGAWSRFGVYVTHASILIIFGGAAIGNVWGYKGFVNIVEGSSVDQIMVRGRQEPLPLGFAVRCDDFQVSFYEGSQRPKLFSSDLVVLENGSEVLKKTIVVNDPLTYRGITFYQSSYGPADDATFRFRIRERATGQTIELTAREGEHVSLPGGYSFAVTNSTESYDKFGPAVQMHVNTPDGQHGNPFIVLQNYPEFDAQRGGEQVFSLVGMDQRFYTGLQVAKDPGVWVVWLGCFLMVLGSCGAFFLSHRRLWVTIQPLNKGVGVKLGGSAHRNQPAFALYFDTLRTELNAALADK
ncbi:MAG: cytochrome c biogenesis protein ResB [Deltaproteobacteria bacterium]|nr:MAG: cytochrome c biogenesis protein ResB [Deltaproteobacteria bacterium]